ncbi:MAG: biotin--[acetyl-CoA-carboxylase] ligase [Clostridia bacterium]|nr:biotin--[acetyl-CoA-carboxylase] ligase [Clostridia bacterium]
MTVPLSASEIATLCADKRYHVAVYPVLPSTNATVRALACDGAPTGTVIFAEQQTAGRGRMGRAFFSPPGSGIYMTVLLRPQLSPADASMITTFAAVATARAIERATGIAVSIKWVNDLWIGERKVCGILAESALDETGRRFSYVALGIGINVKETAFPPELCEIATSLEHECGASVDRVRLAGYLLEALSPLLDGEIPASHMDEYRRRSLILGREITVISGENRFPAVARRIEDDGNLIVQTADGREVRVVAGEVSLKVAR